MWCFVSLGELNQKKLLPQLCSCSLFAFFNFCYFAFLCVDFEKRHHHFWLGMPDSMDLFFVYKSFSLFCDFLFLVFGKARTQPGSPNTPAQLPFTCPCSNLTPLLDQVTGATPLLAHLTSPKKVLLFTASHCLCSKGFLPLGQSSPPEPTLVWLGPSVRGISHLVLLADWSDPVCYAGIRRFI